MQTKLLNLVLGGLLALGVTGAALAQDTPPPPPDQDQNQAGPPPRVAAACAWTPTASSRVSPANST